MQRTPGACAEYIAQVAGAEIRRSGDIGGAEPGAVVLVDEVQRPLYPRRQPLAFASDALGLTAKGRLTRGADADLLAVDGDPFTDAAATRNVPARRGTKVRESSYTW